jgi:hypothetical protein
MSTNTKRLTAGLVAALVLMGACARREAATGGGEQHPHQERSTINWDNPIAGVRVDALESVAALFPFDILMPEGLGSPFKILMTPPENASPESRVLAFLYNSRAYGRVVILEHIPDVPVAEYEESNQKLVQISHTQSNVRGSAEIVPVRGGLPALVTTSEDGKHSTIWWLEAGSFEIVVEGPDLNFNQVIEIANGL